MHSGFETWWAARFGSVPPIGHALRRSLPERWFRIHSLPGRKRYPDAPSEFDEMLTRQGTVAAHVLGVGCPCWLVVHRYEDVTLPELEVEEFGNLRFQRGPALVGEENEMANGRAWAARVPWKAEQARTALCAIANDELRALWISVDSAEVFAPYDGGVDILARDASRAGDLRRRFAAWLSTHPLGL